MRPLLLLRWAARDLRRKWLQVAAIALVIAIGTGVYSALGSTATWRRESNDASFEQTAMYDLRVKAAEGADAARGAMLDRLGRLPDPGVVATAEERLVVPTQVDASTGDETILVPGRIVGVDVTGDGPHVNKVHVEQGLGRTLTPADAGEPVAVLERNFAQFYDLPPETTVTVGGGTELRTTGLGLSPEYFFVTTEEGGFFAQANFSVLFTSLETAQELTGRSGRVNDLVVRLRPGAAPAAVASDLAGAFSGTDLGVTVMEREDEDAYRVLYDDIEGDQRFWNVFAALILAGATFGAFNLSSRMVEAQRREIGIGMALGASPLELAARPVLVGAQIAVLSAFLGVAVGYLAIVALRPVYTELLPMPVWNTEFQPSLFVRGAALGFVLPLVATVWPVWRAVRVAPVDAITTTHRSARGGLAPLLRRFPRPLSAFRRMPLGNVLRTPRRTLLTALGIGAAISTVVVLIGMIDSFVGAMDRSDRLLLQDHPDRVVVALDRLVQPDGPEMRAIRRAPGVGEVDATLRFGGSLSTPGTEKIDALVEVVDFDSTVWAPVVEEGDGDRRGIVIARKAADDLGVGVGGTVSLTHPVPTRTGLDVVTEDVPVAGIHASPYRFNVYVDEEQPVVNQVSVLPAPGKTPDDVESALFELDAVASVQPVAAQTQIVKDALDEFTSVFQVMQGFILFLALLIAYNATSINADERARERATLFAFGLPVRRVLALEVVEGVLYGLMGTAVGIGVGFLVIRWITSSVMSSTMPDIGLDPVVTGGTIAVTVLLGVAAVAVAPLLTVRRLRRMDIPGTLRVVE